MVAWDARSTLVGVNALTPVLFLPAWPVALVAGLTRRWALLGAAGVVVAAHVAFVAPEVAAREPVPAIPAGALRFRLFSANVYAGNGQAGALADELRASAPDVVFLQESSPAFVAALDASGALSGLPHRIAVARTDPFAGLLASRWPLVDQEVVAVDGRPVLIRATAVTESGPIRLYSVHVVAPLGGDRSAWVNALDNVADRARTERLPLLVGGDFNATWAHRAFRDVLSAGLTDAAAARGHPLQMTWPRNHVFPPLIQIDHVLTAGGLTVTGIRTGTGPGSDHRPLVAEVARTGPPPPPVSAARQTQ